MRREPARGAGVEFAKACGFSIGRLHRGTFLAEAAHGRVPSLEQRAAHDFSPSGARCSNSMTSSAVTTISATVEPRARTTGIPLKANTPNDAAAVSADKRTDTGAVSRR